jgi:o-succinylbenzoate synthase
MKIISGHVFCIRIPLKVPFIIAVGSLTHSNHVLVHLKGADGSWGWGESTTFLEVYGYDQEMLAHVIEAYLIPAVIGVEAGDCEELNKRMDAAVPFNLMAKCAVDMAAADMAARSQGLPLCEWFGCRRVEKVPIAGAVGILPPREAARRAENLVSTGFKTVKVKIGTDPDQDIERVLAVRRATGEGILLRVDANQGYSRKEAAYVLGRLETVGLEWVEQPLAAHDLEGSARLCTEFETPVAADESVYDIHDAERIIKRGSADVINIKLPKCGGLSRARKIAALCEESGVGCFLGGCLETTPGTAAQAHFYSATPSVISAAEMEGPWCYTDDVVAARLKFEQGAVFVPCEPGLGVDIDLGKVACYQAFEPYFRDERNRKIPHIRRQNICKK